MLSAGAEVQRCWCRGGALHCTAVQVQVRVHQVQVQIQVQVQLQSEVQSEVQSAEEVQI
mgnify:CR=1 FL=1